MFKWKKNSPISAKFWIKSKILKFLFMIVDRMKRDISWFCSFTVGTAFTYYRIVFRSFVSKALRKFRTLVPSNAYGVRKGLLQAYILEHFILTHAAPPPLPPPQTSICPGADSTWVSTHGPCTWQHQWEGSGDYRVRRLYWYSFETGEYVSVSPIASNKKKFKRI